MSQNEIPPLTPSPQLVGVPGETLLLVRGQGWVPVKQLKSGDFVWCRRLFCEAKQFVRVEANVCIQLDAIRFVKFESGSVGQNRPTRPLLICAGHPVLIENKKENSEKECQQWINGSTIHWCAENGNRDVYAIVTEKPTFFFAQGDLENDGVLVKTCDAAAFCSENCVMQTIFIKQ